MTKLVTRAGSLLASAAALSMIASPALADHRHWGRHHDDIDAGDILTGILIIGGIAAIASAASNNGKVKREREAREREYRDRDYREREDSRGYGDDARGNPGDDRPTWQEGRGIDNAVNRCVGEVERGNRKVETVDSVNRDGEGWKIAGRMAGGDDFACSIGNDGRIRSSTVGGQTVLGEEEEAQPAV